MRRSRRSSARRTATSSAFSETPLPPRSGRRCGRRSTGWPARGYRPRSTSGKKVGRGSRCSAPRPGGFPSGRSPSVARSSVRSIPTSWTRSSRWRTASASAPSARSPGASAPRSRRPAGARRSGMLCMRANPNGKTPGSTLDPTPDLLVHLAEATPEDLAEVARAGVTVAVCPRSNALFGRRPDLGEFARHGVRTLLGTDNAMFHSPSIWRELEFAYVTGRLMKRPVPPEFLFRAAFVEPYRWLGTPDFARLAPGSPARPLVFRLPPDDPEYQIVTRATAQLMVRPGHRRPEAVEREVPTSCSRSSAAEGRSGPPPRSTAAPRVCSTTVPSGSRSSGGSRTPGPAGSSGSRMTTT